MTGEESFHFFIADELSPVGLFNPLSDRGAFASDEAMAAFFARRGA